MFDFVSNNVQSLSGILNSNSRRSSEANFDGTGDAEGIILDLINDEYLVRTVVW